MMITDINLLLGWIGSWILASILGSLWFGPLFGKAWAEGSNLKIEDIQNMPKSKMATLFIFSTAVNGFNTFIATFFYAEFSPIATLLLALFCFILIIGNSLWLGHKSKAYLITASYYTLSILITYIVCLFTVQS